MIPYTDIKALKGSSAWEAYEAWMRRVINTLDSIDDIDFTDMETASVEGRARQLAKERLLELLEPFADHAKQEQTYEDVKKDAGL